MKDFKNMTIKEIDEFIDNLHYTYQKACAYTMIKNIRPDYIPKHRRKENKNDRKSKSSSSR